MKPCLMHRAALVLAIAALSGCASSSGARDGSTPFLTRLPAQEGLGEISLTGLLQGRIVDSDGCFVLRSKGADRAVVFGPRFSLDRELGEIRDDATGQTLRLGTRSRYGGGETSRAEAGAQATAIPAHCPEERVRIDALVPDSR
ncbi:MAG: hypothetical protein ACREPC_04305 [Stenotrophomonas sp.]|uniref:hypothetical protein n=1 Tax=Stenotrophomonas sp. TaxID=69392 RepID=UPI003D6CF0C2